MPAWNRLLHAYGPATDAPAQLAHLESADAVEAASGIEYLWGTILHQLTIYPATAPVVGELIAGLRAGRYPRVAAELTAFLAETFMLAFLAGDVEQPTTQERARVERALDEGDEDALFGDIDIVDASMRDGVLALRALATRAVELARALPPDAAAIALLAYAATAAPEVDVTAQLRFHAGDDSGPVRFAAVHGLKELGADVSAYLDDPFAGVAAALADPSEPRSFAVLIRAALRPRELEAEYPSVRYGSARAAVTVALCEHAPDFASLLPAALASLEVAAPYPLHPGWDTFLRAAWRLEPGGPPALEYLGALAAREDLWEPMDGNARRLYEDLGLPYSRRRCARIAARRP